jgi:hypothetical protein
VGRAKRGNKSCGSLSWLVGSDRADSHKQWMPKMDFPPFGGVDAQIWIDKCDSCFALYQIPATFHVSVASLHMTGPAAHWHQTYKHSENFSVMGCV